MTLYRFQSEDFALSEAGVHLLRNKFNFKTIGYDEITKATIERATEIKNSSLALLFGILLLCFAFYQSRWVVDLFNNPQVYTIYIESIVLPIIPAFLGIYCIYIAVKKGPVLKLEVGNSRHKVRLQSLIKNNTAVEFERFLRTHLGARVFVDYSVMK